MAEHNLPPHPPLLTRGNTEQSFAMSEVGVDPEEEAQRQAQEYLDEAWAPQLSRRASAASNTTQILDEHYRVPHPVGVPDSFDEVRATITAAGRDDIPDRAYNAWLCADCQLPHRGRWRCGVCVPRRRRRRAPPDLEHAEALQQRLDQLGGARRKSKRRRTKRHKRKKRKTRRRRRKQTRRRR